MEQSSLSPQNSTSAILDGIDKQLATEEGLDKFLESLVPYLPAIDSQPLMESISDAASAFEMQSLLDMVVHSDEDFYSPQNTPAAQELTGYASDIPQSATLFHPLHEDQDAIQPPMFDYEDPFLCSQVLSLGGIPDTPNYNYHLHSDHRQLTDTTIPYGDSLMYTGSHTGVTPPALVTTGNWSNHASTTFPFSNQLLPAWGLEGIADFPSQQFESSQSPNSAPDAQTHPPLLQPPFISQRSRVSTSISDFPSFQSPNSAPDAQTHPPLLQPPFISKRSRVSTSISDFPSQQFTSFQSPNSAPDAQTHPPLLQPPFISQRSRVSTSSPPHAGKSPSGGNATITKSQSPVEPTSNITNPARCRWDGCGKIVPSGKSQFNAHLQAHLRDMHFRGQLPNVIFSGLGNAMRGRVHCLWRDKTTCPYSDRYRSEVHRGQQKQRRQVLHAMNGRGRKTPGNGGDKRGVRRSSITGASVAKRMRDALDQGIYVDEDNVYAKYAPLDGEKIQVDSLLKHICTVHLMTMAANCAICGGVFTRPDSQRRHICGKTQPNVDADSSNSTDGSPRPEKRRRLNAD